MRNCLIPGVQSIPRLWVSLVCLKLWNVAEIVKFCQNCEIWPKLWNLVTPISFARFRFGLEGWKDVNQEQWIGHNSHKGRLRVARAAKNIMTLWFDSDWTWNCDDLQDPLPPLVGTQAPQQLRQLRCIWSTNNMTCASGHQYILQIGTNYVDIETMGSTSVP